MSADDSSMVEDIIERASNMTNGELIELIGEPAREWLIEQAIDLLIEQLEIGGNGEYHSEGD